MQIYVIVSILATFFCFFLLDGMHFIRIFAAGTLNYCPMKRIFVGLMAMIGMLSLSAQDVSQNEVIQNIMARRSVRKYLDKPVEHAKLEAIATAGINAPSAMNRQNWAVRIIEDQKLIADVTEVYKQENPQMVERDPNFKNMFRNAPNLICVCSPSNGGFDLDAGLLCENMMLAAQSLGLGTCIQTGPVRFLVSNEKAKFFLEALDIPDGYKLLCVIAVGYPDEKPDAKPRDASKVKYIGTPAAETSKDDRIFVDYESNAHFPGGEEACMKWLSDNMQYPEDCLKEQIEGRVVVSFVVERDGSISEVKTKKSPHLSLSKEAERLVQSMPKWAPRRQGNKAVRSIWMLPVVFKIP
jgi:TonB family protein